MIGQPTLDLDLPALHHDHRRLIGRCPVDGCTFTRTGLDADEHGISVMTGTRCRTHNRPLRWQRVQGSYSPGIRCDSRCQFARGPQCDCSCAGANHGRGWT